MDVEINFDGIVGPTHHYGGLSTGNLASDRHRLQVSNPREAALQGLAKMDFLAGKGVLQAVLPPSERPNLPVLRAAGFSGPDSEIVRRALEEAPGLLSACYSASSMWTANAATYTPAVDAADGRSHFTPANLVSMFHRSIEPPSTAALLRKIFGDERYFAHHDPLPPGRPFSDEGAANHARFSAPGGGPGVHLFVYGFAPFEEEPRLRFPARQSLEASCAIARRHGISGRKCIFARQAPEAIEAGVFHNDVAAVGNENVFIYHEQAFADGDETARRLSERVSEICGCRLHVRMIPASRVSLDEAVRTYLFNSQLVTLPGGGMMLLAPAECRHSPSVNETIGELMSDKELHLTNVSYVDLSQSMRNGGGPACLRFRVMLPSEQLKLLRGRVLLTPELSAAIAGWIRRNYRDRLAPPDLADPELIGESRKAAGELRDLLELA